MSEFQHFREHWSQECAKQKTIAAGEWLATECPLDSSPSFDGAIVYCPKSKRVLKRLGANCDAASREYTMPLFVQEKCNQLNQSSECRIVTPTNFSHVNQEIYMAIPLLLGDLLSYLKLYKMPVPSFDDNYRHLFTTLGVMHDNRLLHNDLYSRNIFYDDKDRLWLADFGNGEDASNSNEELQQKWFSQEILYLSFLFLRILTGPDFLKSARDLQRQYKQDEKRYDPDVAFRFANYVATLTIVKDYKEEIWTADDMLNMQVETLLEKGIDPNLFVARVKLLM